MACVMSKSMDHCTTHSCAAKVITVMSKKWKYKEKLRQYGYVSARTKKIICSIRKSGPVQSVQPDHIMQTSHTHTPDSTLVQSPGDVYSSGVGISAAIGGMKPSIEK